MSESTPQAQAPVVILDEFLVAQEWRALLEFTLVRESEFTSTQVIDANGTGRVDSHYRRSRVLYDLGPYNDLFAVRLMRFLPHVLTMLGHPWFQVRNIELQLTATNNGEYFRMHTDNDAAAVASRAITAVYFFHREPSAFGGGELRIMDTVHEAGRVRAPGPSRIVYPRQNQIVFFPSGLLHEIQPVQAVQDDFCNSRFTVNGWLHA